MEVPHRVQDDVVLWALSRGMHVLVGGSLAATRSAAREVTELAARRNLLVEAGYEARYKGVWHTAADLIRSGDLGEVLAVPTTALVDQDPKSWYEVDPSVKQGQPQPPETTAGATDLMG